MSGGDIVERLQQVAWLAEEGSEVTDIAATAADEVERLRALADQLADALRDACDPALREDTHDTIFGVWQEAQKALAAHAAARNIGGAGASDVEGQP